MQSSKPLMVYVSLTQKRKRKKMKFNEFEGIEFVIKKPDGDWCMKNSYYRIKFACNEASNFTSWKNRIDKTCQ